MAHEFNFPKQVTMLQVYVSIGLLKNLKVKS